MTITVSGSCPVLYLTTFNNGLCYSCSVSIGAYIYEDALQICASSTSSNLKKRGYYFLYDCADNYVNADWDVLEGLSNFTVVGLFTNTISLKIIPKYQWMIGYNYTIRAFAPGTTNLIASYVITIQDCDVCTTCRPASGNSSFSYAPDTKQLVYATDEPGKINIELIDPTTGVVAFTLKNLRAQSGKNTFSLNKPAIQKNKIYVVRLTTENGTIITDKIMY